MDRGVDWSPTAALLVTSLLFGLAHLWFRSFPNWRWVPVAAVLGWFCGRARNQAGSIRAGMVTHVLVVTTGGLSLCRDAWKTCSLQSICYKNWYGGVKKSHKKIQIFVASGIEIYYYWK